MNNLWFARRYFLVRIISHVNTRLVDACARLADLLSAGFIAPNKFHNLFGAVLVAAQDLETEASAPAV